MIALIAWISGHWLLALVLAFLGIGFCYLLYCAWLTGCGMFEEFFGPPA